MSAIAYKSFGFCQKWNALTLPRVLEEGFKALWRDGKDGEESELKRA
jgi:hypothetical protein